MVNHLAVRALTGLTRVAYARTLSGYALRVYLALVIGFAGLKSKPLMGFVDAICYGQAVVTGWILSLFDGSVLRKGAFVYRRGADLSVEVTPVCSALEYNLLLVLAVLLLPIPLLRRLKLAVLSIICVQMLNVLRLAVLVYGADMLPRWRFDLLHEQVLAFFLAVGVTLYLVFTLRPRHRGMPDADTP